MYVFFKKVKWDNNNQFGIYCNKIGIIFFVFILIIMCGIKEISFRFFFFECFIKVEFERNIIDYSLLCNSFMQIRVKMLMILLIVEGLNILNEN